MEKVFLCHASNDKEYVRIIAKKLGRAKVVFDELTFEPGHDFREDMIKGLDKSILFVFIVSRASINSVWCKYELDEAHLRKISGTIKRQLAIIIEPNITYNDLPPWMQKFKAVIQPRPTQATRDIQRELFAILPPDFHKPFVGRQQLQQEYTTALSATDQNPVKVFVMSGLEGVGRRSYLERISRDVLGLHLGPYYTLNETQGLDDLYLWCLDETADLGTRANMAKEMRAFSELSQSDKVNEIVHRLHLLCNDNSIPCLVDQGGMLDDSGKYKIAYADLLNSFTAADEDHYLAMIHRRAPFVADLECNAVILHQRVRSLELHESKLLLQQLCRKMGLTPKAEELHEIADYLDGYPPAAYFAARHAQSYGIGTTVADKSLLVEFKAKSFTRFVSDLKLSEKEWLILQYLASEQLVPLSAIAIVVETTTEDTAPLLRNLIDNSLVDVVDENFGVSPPIRAAVLRAKGYITKSMYDRIRINLTKEYWADNNAAPSIEIVDATLHAVARSGSTEFDPYRDLVRVSIVHRLAQECYHRKEWDLALDYSKRAEAMGADKPDIRAIHFKALVQLERWEDAGKQLKNIEHKHDRQAFYLKGFMLRKRQRFAEAIKAFESALAAGDHSFSVHRDYAECLYREQRYKEAFEKIKWLLDRQPENIFVLDQVIRIYIDSVKYGGAAPPITEKDADTYLERLERFDFDKRFIHHRRATLLAMKGLWQQALTAAEAACSTSHSPFEAYALKIDILIELEQFKLAEQELADLEKRYRSIRQNVQIGTRCKLLIRQGKWREAEAAWNKLSDKDRPVHQGLMRRILELKSQDMTVTLAERQQAAKEASDLKVHLRVPDSLSVIDFDQDIDEANEQ